MPEPESRYHPGPQTSISELLSPPRPDPEDQKPTPLRLFPASAFTSEMNDQPSIPKVLWPLGQMKRLFLCIRAKIISLTL